MAGAEATPVAATAITPRWKNPEDVMENVMRTVIAVVFCFAAADKPIARSAPNARYQAASREPPTSPSAWAWRDRAVAQRRAKRERAEARVSK